MDETPTFKNPPIVEFVLGAQFAPLKNLSSAHFGRYWKMLGSNWVNPRDNPLIADQFERFGDSVSKRKWLLQLETAPATNRITLINQKSDRLIQLQPTRFHLNWRKTEELKPSYKCLIEEFEKEFEQFVSFCESENLGSVAVNQWEVTYVNSFPKEQYWESPNDWNKFLPGLFRDEPSILARSLRMESRNVQWIMEIEPRLGRLHLSSGIGQWREGDESLMLNLTARGPLVQDHTPTLRAGLDLGHRVAVEQFLMMVEETTKNSWEEIK